MATFLLSLSLWGAAFLAHLVLWRIWLPRPATNVLLGLFFGTLAVGLLVAAWPLGLISSPWQMLQVSLFHTAFSLAYIIVYTGIEETSPTLAVVRAVQLAGAQGCSREDLEKVVNDADFLEPRLETLQASGLIVEEAENCRLTNKGVKLARLMTCISTTFLNLPKGG